MIAMIVEGNLPVPFCGDPVIDIGSAIEPSDTGENPWNPNDLCNGFRWLRLNAQPDVWTIGHGCGNGWDLGFNEWANPSDVAHAGDEAKPPTD
jgi:hypothetical protein